MTLDQTEENIIKQEDKRGEWDSSNQRSKKGKKE